MQLPELRGFISRLSDNRGPEPDQYVQLTAWYDHINRLRLNGELTVEQLNELRNQMGGSFQTDLSLQGRIFRKPLGYAGDFVVIDSFYEESVSCDPELERWDSYIQSLAATKAVRNRKSFFIEVFNEKAKTHLDTGFRMLDVACGSCRDVKEAIESSGASSGNAEIHCIDFEPKAIEFSKELLRDHLAQVTFHTENILKYQTPDKFDFVWSAGLFDYFSDKVFVRMLQRFREWLLPNGEAIVGNFCSSNPSLGAMEFGDWFLNYRDEEQLRDLALQAGFRREEVSFSKEEQGINLFLRLRKDSGN